jgi:prolyl oligopeptidase
MRSLANIMLVLSAFAIASPVSAALKYPETRRLDLVEKQFGVDVADPYRWLEDDVRINPEVRQWVTTFSSRGRRQ